MLAKTIYAEYRKNGGTLSGFEWMRQHVAESKKATEAAMNAPPKKRSRKKKAKTE